MRRFLTASLLLLSLRHPAFADSFVVTGARVADGTGKPLRTANVRVEGDTITEVGAFLPRKGERVVDGRGLVLAPGFIDIHNHSTEGLLSDPLAETQVSQGITTLVQGPDGESPWPIGEYLQKLAAAPPATNVLMMAGHATIRQLVMGDDYRRVATPAEVEKMAALVEQAMREGAAGLSTGLEYDVGSYSETSELVALSKAAAKHGGFYMSHIRDEAAKCFPAFAEAIAIGEQSPIPVQISHIKMGTVSVWNRAPEVVAMVEKARARGTDVLADCYPYEAWHSNMEVLVPNKKYDDPASVETALAEVGGAGNILITECKVHPDYERRTLAEIAQSLGITPTEAYIRMVKDGGAEIIGHSMIEKDVRVFYTQPWVMVGSDGGVGSKHPRGAGTFPRVLGRYVREKHWLTLPEAIRKMTSLPAKRLKLADRGVLRAGMKADLVLFDPKTVLDRSTFEKPQELSQGIQAVFVNGIAVWEAGKAPGARPGRVLMGPGLQADRKAAAGHLIIVGGGPLPDAIERRFVELAGGAGKARIVAFPMASKDPDAGREIVKDFEKLGARAERIVLDRAGATEEAARRLDGVTGVWFGGGDQALLTAALSGTPVERAIHERYLAGAVVGGTSAGAAVMSTPMITGDEKHPGGSRPPKDSSDSASAFMTIARDNIVTADGFDLLPGAIVDQHFVRRRRLNRLISVVLEHPERVGVGIDESTALEVGPDGSWKVLGESVAVVFDARQARITPPGQAPLGAAGVAMQVLPAGSLYDPASGRVTLPPSP